MRSRPRSDCPFRSSSRRRRNEIVQECCGVPVCAHSAGRPLLEARSCRTTGHSRSGRRPGSGDVVASCSNSFIGKPARQRRAALDIASIVSVRQVADLLSPRFALLVTQLLASVVRTGAWDRREKGPHSRGGGKSLHPVQKSPAVAERRRGGHPSMTDRGCEPNLLSRRCATHIGACQPASLRKRPRPEPDRSRRRCGRIRLSPSSSRRASSRQRNPKHCRNGLSLGEGGGGWGVARDLVRALPCPLLTRDPNPSKIPKSGVRRCRRSIGWCPRPRREP